MFCRLSLLAFVAPLVSALTLDVPENPTSGGTITIKWNSAPNDPDTWSFELINTAFNNAFAIANNVNPTAGQVTLTLPIVPVGSGYTLQAVNIGDINDVFASTSSFSIGAATAVVPSSSSTPLTSATGSSTGATGTPITTPTIPTTGVTSNIVSSSLSSSSTSASASTLPTPSSAALSSRLGLSNPAGGIAAILLSAAAGAAMIAL